MAGPAETDRRKDTSTDQRTREHRGSPYFPAPEEVRRFAVTVTDGPAAGLTWESTEDRCAIGSHELNQVVIDDPTVSRFHCELRIGAEGARLIDLASRNGTLIDGVRVMDAFLRSGSEIRLGTSVLRYELRSQTNKLAVSPESRFGPLVGTSLAMRSTFAMLERAGSTDVTVLLEGETGTGKSRAAEAIHQHSARAARPLVVVDCGAIPAPLLESELFGHEKGAFTGATERRLGAFETAHGGTLFLDEIGELPLDLQPKLLRAIEAREIKRVGASTYRPIDVRIIAATHRDLRTAVNEAHFRADLYFRLAVVKIRIPAVREHPEDIPVLVERLLAAIDAPPADLARLLTPESIRTLQAGAWPGNVRELRNHLERCLFFQEALPPGDADIGPAASGTTTTDATPPGELEATFAEARRAAVERFERRYLEALLARHGGNVAKAARSAAVHRVHLHRLLRQYGIKGRDA